MRRSLVYFRSMLVRGSRAVAPWTASRENLQPPLQGRAMGGVPRTFVLVAGLAGIVLWQGVFYRHSFPAQTLSTPYVLKASRGALASQHEFVYFLYYLGLYPVVTTTKEGLELSPEGARRVFETQGDTLLMDRFCTIRYGELLKTYLYLPHAYLAGSPTRRPLMVPANAAAWTLSLIALFVAFWRVGRPTLGAILVLLLGSNPFQVGEVYARNTVMGWPITTLTLVLALHLPLLTGRRLSTIGTWLLPVVTGLGLATVRQIRSEPTAVIASAALAYLLATPLSKRRRLALVALLGVSFWAGSQAWAAYFDAKFHEAYERVKAAGGHPLEAPRQRYHFFWHALWCGLGDFDTKYGYEWNDVAAKNWALSILAARGFKPAGYPALTAEPSDGLTLGVYWDKDRKYARTPFEAPEYIALVREKVVHDITHDPLWYLGILGRRVVRILATTTPPSLSLGDGRGLSLPPSSWWGPLAILVAALLVRVRGVFLLKVLAFTLPLSATAFLVYSGSGTVYYNVFHLVGFGYLAAWALEGLLDKLRTRLVLGVA